jgi:hypothetical protein
MRMIKLTMGRMALVDDDIFEGIKDLKWRCQLAESRRQAYAVTRSGKTTEFIHWYVAGRPRPGYVVDHINGDGLDNRRANLRVVSTRDNLLNSHRHRAGRLPGTSLDRRAKKYAAWIYYSGRSHYLGQFKTEIEAHETYMRALQTIPR